MRSIVESRIGIFSFFLVLVLTFSLELALVERKYNLLFGGYGQSHQLQSIAELAIFFVVIIICQIVALYLLYLVIIKLHYKTENRRLSHYNFVFFTVTLVGVSLAVKYQVLNYFSDAISFQLIKRLGGGSTIDALLYVTDEAGIIGSVLVALVAAYYLGIKLFSIRRPIISDATHQPRAIGKLYAVAVIAALSITLYAVNDTRNIRYALDRFFAFKIINQALAEITDFDRDGYSYYSALEDGFPFDSARYPLALDVPGNGIDEDGFAGDFSFIAPPEMPMPQISDTKKNFVLIVLESTRGDALGKVVDGTGVTPNLSALAAGGTSISNAYSHVGFTAPSLKSMFSGSLHASEKTRSLFRDLKENGYSISVFSGQPETFGGISQAVGMQASSDNFLDAESLIEQRAFSFTAKGSLLIDGQILLKEFDQRMGKVEHWQEPTFVYINFQSAHFPYYHEGMRKTVVEQPIPRGKISKDNKEWVAKTYWNAVAYGDWLVGQVISRLKELGVYDNTLVIVTADHGESLFDDGFLGHGHAINTQQTRIPLIINRPGITVPEPIGLSDYYEMIMGLLGADAPYGKSLGPREGKNVFQFIGRLDRPRSIGIIEAGNKWTVLDMDTQVVSFYDLEKSIHYQDLEGQPMLKQRSERLVNEWAYQRWQQHLSRNTVQAKQ